MKSRWMATLGVAALLAAAVPVAAAEMWMPNVTDSPSRFSGPGVYTGKPALPVTLSMVIAGGGPEHFATLTLVKVLAGDKTDAEVAALKQKFGDAKVTNFVTIFPFVVSDSLKIAKAKGVALPSAPNPDPKNGEALAGALWAAGQTGHGFNVEVMLDRAVSHPIHDASDDGHRCKVRHRRGCGLPRRAQSSHARSGNGLPFQLDGRTPIDVTQNAFACTTRTFVRWRMHGGRRAGGPSGWGPSGCKTGGWRNRVTLFSAVRAGRRLMLRSATPPPTAGSMRNSARRRRFYRITCSKTIRPRSGAIRKFQPAPSSRCGPSSNTAQGRLVTKRSEYASTAEVSAANATAARSAAAVNGVRTSHTAIATAG